MEIFRLDIPTIRERIKKVLISIAVIYIVVNGVAVLILFQMGHQHDLFLHLFPVLMVSTMLSGILSLNITRRRKILESYQLIFEEDKVTRKVGNYPEVVLSYNEIEAIYRHPDGTYKIKGPALQIFIHIPKEIEQVPELEQQLQQIKAFSEEPQYTQKKYRNLIFTLLSLVCSVTFFTSYNKWLTLTSGILLMGTLIVTSIITIRHPLLNQTMKNRAWISLLLVLIIGFMMYNKLTFLR